MADYTLVSLFDDQEAVEMLTCPNCKALFYKSHRLKRACSPKCSRAIQNGKKSRYRAAGMKRCSSCREIRNLDDFPVPATTAKMCKPCLKLRDAGKKRCSDCRKVKGREEFHPRKTDDGHEANCKDCSAKRSKAYRGRPEVRERTRNRRYMTRFNISAAEYDRMYAERSGLCDICRQPPLPTERGLAIDHDHACCPGEKTCGSCIRGLVCYRCNSALGMVRDDLRIATNLITYLRRHAA